MQDVLDYASWAADFFKAGFAQINLVLAVVIALYWSWRIADWGTLVTTAIGAVVMYLVALILAPMVDHNAALHLPPYQDPAYWRLVAALFLGFTVAVGALFFVKSQIVNRASASGSGSGMLTAGAGHHGTSDLHGGGHEDHGHGGGHDDHGHGDGHGASHDDHGHGDGHGQDNHGHGGGHDEHGHGGHGGGHGHH